MLEIKTGVNSRTLTVVAQRDHAPSARREIKLAWWPVHLLVAVGVLLVAFYTPVNLLGALFLGVAAESAAISFVIALALAALPRAKSKAE